MKPTDSSAIQHKKNEDFKICIFLIMVSEIHWNGHIPVESLSIIYSVRFYWGMSICLSALYLILNVTLKDFKNYVCD